MTVPFYPLLLAVYPILALLASNIDQVHTGSALRPALLSAASALLLMGALRLRLRDWHRAAALAGLASLAFFTYGHVYDVLKNVEVMGGLLGRHRYLIPASLAVIGFAGWRIVRLRDGRQLTRMLNVVAIALVALPVLQLALYQGQLRRGQVSAHTGAGALVGRRPDRPPDVYYIVLDAYARQDVLRSRFGIDNTGFLDGLRDLGFQVAECAQSNYAQTELTLATTLNLDYLDRLGDFPAGGHDRTPLLFLIRESAVRQILERMGYQVYAFETGYAFSEWQDADVYLHPPRQGFDFPLTAFEGILLETTALTILIDARSILPPSLGGALEGPLDVHRERVLYDLATLPQLAERPGPKFVFAHIVAPHRPYLFAPQPHSTAAQEARPPGFAADEADGYILGYRNQVLYLNDEVLPILRRLIQDSAVPPIILIHGDHGPDEATGAERMAILNAGFFPGLNSESLSSVRSPINNFRLVLRQYFGIDLPDLDDSSFYSTYDAPFDLLPIEQSCAFDGSMPPAGDPLDGSPTELYTGATTE